MQHDPARLLARTVVRTGFGDLPSEAVSATKDHVVHILGTVLAGSAAPGCDMLHRLVSRWGGAPESHVLVYGGAVPAPHAALVHSAMAHAWEFDNNDDRIAYKSSTAAIPAALATAERLGGVSGRELIAAVCLGVDLGLRIGLATNPKPTHSEIAALGPFAAAAACGKLIGLDEERLLDAFGIAYCEVSISPSGTSSPSLSKRLLAGLAARNGVFAAELAALGYPANPDVLSGDKGYFRHLRGQEGDFETLTAALGEHFEIVGVGPKAYPSCRWTGAAIDATLNLARRYDLRPEQVQAVTVRMSRHELASLGGVDDPAADAKRHPVDAVDAQFSIPYTVARALVSRDVRLEDFTPPAFQDPRVRDLAERVRPVADDGLDDWPLLVKPAIVEVVLDDGTRLVERVDYPKGSARNPVPPAEIRANFRACARFATRPVSNEQIDAALELLDDLEHVEDVMEVVRALEVGAVEQAGAS